MEKIEQLVAEFARKLVAEAKTLALPNVHAATAFGLAAKILAMEESANVPFDDCVGWAKKHLNDGFAWDVSISQDAAQPIITPVAPKHHIIVE